MTITISKEFVKSNYLYLIWFVFYFFLSWLMFGLQLSSLVFLIITYTISITIALSPIGEKLFRVISNVRSLETMREKDRLIPIFEDVYDEVKNHYPNIVQDIEICIIDAMYINAFAIGKRTVAVTRGAVDSLSDDEIKGLIAHEIGHIYHGDTKAVLLTVIGNGIFTIFNIISRWTISMIEMITMMIHGSGFIALILFLARLLAEAMLFFFSYLGQIILSINSRANEYSADMFSYEVGFGEQLVEVLYMLQGMTISDKSKLVQKMKASHPNIAKRIGRLETLIYDE